jgi:hypothetical protein
MLLNAAITISVLRRELRCNLPVEVVHYGPGELEQQAVQLIKGGQAASWADVPTHAVHMHMHTQAMPQVASWP